MTDEPALIRALKLQAQGCLTFGSAFSAALLEHMATDWSADGPTRALFAPWEGVGARALLNDAVPLRLLAGLHDLALEGVSTQLTEAYPSTLISGDADKAWGAAMDILTEHQDRLVHFMRHEPQTNEVCRSACLLGGFLHVAAETKLPMRTFELGASAGLNQLWDRFGYRLGEGRCWGDANSPVRIEADWRGTAPPLNAQIEVISRAACDRKPVDLNDSEARQRLRAYVWADQANRLARLDAAIALALEVGAKVQTADAVDFTRSIQPQSAAVTVIYHSVFWQYVPQQGQIDLAAAILALGESATRANPVAWVRMEPPAENPANMQLLVTLWPGGEDRLLGYVHPHGTWANWD